MAATTTPGRRRDLKHQPIFLRKTYHMISNCPPSIASWSDAGDSFVVKNTQDFAAKVIPCFFKHSNFSSFVRQLNFYGFRKVKAESILNTGNETKSWEFRHDKFIRGQPGLLSEIRRASGYANSEPSIPQEVDELKAEVVSLRSQVEMLTHTARDLTMLINTFVRERNNAASGLPITPLSELPLPTFEATGSMGIGMDVNGKRSDSCDPDGCGMHDSDSCFSVGSGSTTASTSARSQRRLRSPRSPRPVMSTYASSSLSPTARNQQQQFLTTTTRGASKLSVGTKGGRRGSTARASSSASTTSASSMSSSSPPQLYHGETFASSSITDEEEDEEEDDDDDFPMMMEETAAAVPHQQHHMAPTVDAKCDVTGATVVPQQQPQGVDMDMGASTGSQGQHAEEDDGDNQEFAESLRAFFPIEEDPTIGDEGGRGFQGMLLKNFLESSGNKKTGTADEHQDGLNNNGGSTWETAASPEGNEVSMEVKMGAMFENAPPPPLSSSVPPSGAGCTGHGAASVSSSYVYAPCGLTATAVLPHQHMVSSGAAPAPPPPRQKRKLSNLEEEASMFAGGPTAGVC